MMNDEQLMNGFYAGQDQAFGMICRQYHFPLVRFAYGRLPGRLAGRYECAEDLVQSSLECVFRTRQRPAARWNASKGSVKNWLYAILRNQLFSLIRTKRGKEQLQTDLPVNDRQSGSKESELRDAGIATDPLGMIMAREDQVRLGQALEELSPEDQDLIYGKYVLGKTQAEIAEESGASKPTISRRHGRALQTLRRSVNNALTPSRFQYQAL